MAVINELNITQSRFTGSPVTVPVTAAIVSGATFHRVRLSVFVYDTNGVLPQDLSSDVFSFSQPAADGETVTFDIASAFRALLSAWEPQPDTFAYPVLKAEVQAFDDYLIDGVSHEGESPSGIVYILNKVAGSLTDRERGAGVTGTWQEPARFSRRPTATASGVTAAAETAFTGCDFLLPGATGANTVPAVSRVTVTEGLSADGSLYGVARPADGYELRFINSLGVHENVFVTALRSTEVSTPSERLVRTVRENLTAFSRGIMRKQPFAETWTLTSGPLTQPMFQWWLYDVLAATVAWLRVDGMWLPVSILTEETVTGFSRVSAEMQEIQFSVRFNINGSPVAY